VLSSESVTNVLLALATGFSDRAVNVVAMSTEIDEEARAVLWGALVRDQDGAEQARRFGDALRSLGARRHLVNECYRVAFYAGEEWKALSGNPLYAFFTANRGGFPLDKWVHYFPIYDRHLSRYRGLPTRVLEIGVYRGGGLELLRHYLGSAAYLVGIDIDEAARIAVADRHPIEIGDQEDPEFLRRVEKTHGPFDIVIDDGGHTMGQQIASVETLFPLLSDGATYVVEDCHTSYWPEYLEPESVGTFIEWVKARIDDLHAYHHSTALDLGAPWQTDLGALHLYDSVVVMDKLSRSAPFSEFSGTKEFINYNRDVSTLQVEMLATRDAALARLQETEGTREELRVLRGELMDAKEAAVQLQGDLETTRVDLVGSWGIIQEMRRSRSWKATAPLRRLKSLLNRR
jgi:cephalosporin hydroxylase